MHASRQTSPGWIAPLLLALAAALSATTAAAVAAESPKSLRGDQEVPPVTTVASGLNRIVIHDDRTVTGTIETNEIDGTAAHIHVGAAGTNGPVVVTLTRTLVNQWSVPAGTVLTEAEFASYKAGNLYVNVHSMAHTAGEIRLQLSP